MVCLGVHPGAAGWKAQTNPLSYGGTPKCSTVMSIILSLYHICDIYCIIFVDNLSFREHSLLGKDHGTAGLQFNNLTGFDKKVNNLFLSRSEVVEYKLVKTGDQPNSDSSKNDG